MDATELDGVPVEASNGSNPDPSIPTIPGDVELQSEGPAPDPWDGKSRVTILVMGLDYRDWEAGDPPRSDTMVLFTLDPDQHRWYVVDPARHVGQHPGS